MAKRKITRKEILTLFQALLFGFSLALLQGPLDGFIDSIFTNSIFRFVLGVSVMGLVLYLFKF